MNKEQCFWWGFLIAFVIMWFVGRATTLHYRSLFSQCQMEVEYNQRAMVNDCATEFEKMAC